MIILLYIITKIRIYSPISIKKKNFSFKAVLKISKGKGKTKWMKKTLFFLKIF